METQEFLKQFTLHDTVIEAVRYFPEQEKLVLEVEVCNTEGHIPDEIALLFDDAWMVYADELAEEGLITLDQRKALEHMNETLDHMSQNKDVWTLTSLESSSEWANVRHLAHDILVSFQEVKRAPQLFWVQYIEP